VGARRAEFDRHCVVPGRVSGDSRAVGKEWRPVLETIVQSLAPLGAGVALAVAIYSVHGFFDLFFPPAT